MRLSTKLENFYTDSLTSKGGGLMSFDELRNLRSLAAARGVIVQSVEAYEVHGDMRWARLDATFSYPHTEYAATKQETILQAGAALDYLHSSVPDSRDLLFLVWIDPDPV
jgi:hypothetical protein